MDEEAKKAMDALFAEDKQRVEKVEKARDLEAEAQAKFVSDFVEVRDSVIIPAMKEFADYIKPHGWTGELEVAEDTPEHRGYQGKVDRPATAAAAGMVFYRGDTRTSLGAGRTYPHFRIAAVKRAKNVWFHESTMGPNHGGSAGGAGTATLDQFNASFVQDRMVKHFKKLMENAKPYDQR
ncbi:hypothetical protein LPN01_18840 [Sphingomonas sp. A2-49]|uniref:hypothetical protein n=1 Tax=Sphingomonas sp. A2-49 TaxID=1391375 RepID=UPI0021CDF502|nr:hypothetical protein [Sphingomonas sp. A2-49]MCU6456139.1 hypothetical protein [Sphingomonas sp. A2-49]